MTTVKVTSLERSESTTQQIVPRESIVTTRKGVSWYVLLAIVRNTEELDVRLNLSNTNSRLSGNYGNHNLSTPRPTSPP